MHKKLAALLSGKITAPATSTTASPQLRWRRSTFKESLWKLGTAPSTLTSGPLKQHCLTSVAKMLLGRCRSLPRADVSVSRVVTTLLERFPTVKHGSLVPVHVALALVLRWLNIFGILPINMINVGRNGPGGHLGLSCHWVQSSVILTLLKAYRELYHYGCWETCCASPGALVQQQN